MTDCPFLISGNSCPIARVAILTRAIRAGVLIIDRTDNYQEFIIIIDPLSRCASSRLAHGNRGKIRRWPALKIVQRPKKRSGRCLAIRPL